MSSISLCFEVHQPFRVRKEVLKGEEDLFNAYFDDKVNRELFERISYKCYYPATEIILEEINRFKDEYKKFKVAFSLSGIFLEQCKEYNPGLLDLFRKLAKSGCVEFLSQTYYHSLAALYENKDEFISQVELHRKTIKKLLGTSPVFFENTELIFNNVVASTVEGMGFKGIFSEGVERVLGWRSPNYVYHPFGSDIKVLMRNYQLTDDVGFRFSARDWKEYPLTAEKYSAWLAGTPGQCINLFMDYETLGEHHWPETGIHEFLRFLPGEVLKYDHLEFLTPSEIAEKHAAVGEVDVPEWETTSWADLERSTACWLSNDMQRECFDRIKRLDEKVKMLKDKKMLNVWRYLQTSDHLHHIYTEGGGPGEVHSYFSPCESAVEAFRILDAVLTDFEKRVERKLR
ncbi:glycoside hydrolase family 57 protein [archaeon]|nr:glycoside hydrolase family 57 protein [archaeon]